LYDQKGVDKLVEKSNKNSNQRNKLSSTISDFPKIDPNPMTTQSQNPLGPATSNQSRRISPFVSIDKPKQTNTPTTTGTTSSSSAKTTPIQTTSTPSNHLTQGTSSSNSTTNVTPLNILPPNNNLTNSTTNTNLSKIGKSKIVSQAPSSSSKITTTTTRKSFLTNNNQLNKPLSNNNNNNNNNNQITNLILFFFVLTRKINTTHIF
jgi:hypothetical protein